MKPSEIDSANDNEWRFAKAVNDWCRDHDALVLEAHTYQCGAGYSLTVLLQKTLVVRFEGESASDVLHALDTYNAELPQS